MLSAFMTLTYDHAAAKTYLKRSIKKAMQTFIDMQDVDFITDVLNLGFVTMKNFDEIFAYVNAKKGGEFTELKVVLLNYKEGGVTACLPFFYYIRLPSTFFQWMYGRCIFQF